MRVLTVNVGRPKAVEYTSSPSGTTGIDKRPAEGPVRVSDPGPKGEGGSGVAGDAVCELRFHGGTHQAVYAFAREDLDYWEGELGRPLANGSFGENLTTTGFDVNAALIGERWRIGSAVLEVASGRVPCRTFAGWLGEKGWVRRFTQRAAPGPYLRVVEPGEIRAGDAIEVVHRPDHEVTVEFAYRAFTLRRELLPRTLAAGEALDPEVREAALAYTAQATHAR
ncbi:MOSC domain-containing protein [Streptomyces sp. NPDC049837]|uniref:MOSC domain-containing protein n=1 Tax=Streptomyces sp. NPDC049837 TaxID=3155277 RepID=UPI0034435168